MHDDHAFAVVHDEVHVVLDDQEGVALLAELVEVVQQARFERRVDPGERLVEQEHVRVGQQGTREFEELALAPREVARALLGEVVDVEELQGLPDAFEEFALLALHPTADERGHRPPERLAPLVLRREHHVLEDGHLLEFPGDLEGPDEPPVGDLIRFESGDVLPVEVDRAVVGFVDAGDAVEHRRLARAVRADQPGEPAGLDREARPVDRDDPPETLVEVLDAQRQGGRRARAVLLDRRVDRLRWWLAVLRGARRLRGLDGANDVLGRASVVVPCRAGCGRVGRGPVVVSAVAFGRVARHLLLVRVGFALALVRFTHRSSLRRPPPVGRPCRPVRVARGRWRRRSPCDGRAAPPDGVASTRRAPRP
jgi:hypothetical protein